MSKFFERFVFIGSEKSDSLVPPQKGSESGTIRVRERLRLIEVVEK